MAKPEHKTSRRLSSKRVDQLGLRSAMSDRLLPTLVGAMSFLAALAIAGTLAAATLASHWQGDTGAALTVQVTNPNDPAASGSGPRLQAVLGILQANRDVSDSHLLTPAEMNNLLKPWLGVDTSTLALPVPAVITGTWHEPGPPDALGNALNTVAPGTLTETGARWASRVAALTGSIQASAAAVLLIVALVAAAVVSVATRAGLAQRREAIEIIHGLGALDSYIASRFAFRATKLAATGAATGALLALPVLFWLAELAAPFAGVLPQNNQPQLPTPLWASLATLPIAAAAIGWGTTQLTVRGWLKRLA
jgi:cell division transport system permease protein